MWRLVRRPLPLYAFMVLALAFLSRCTSLDDEIYERQNESTFLAATLMEKLVKFYNLTETFQEKVSVTPYSEDNLSKQVFMMFVGSLIGWLDTTRSLKRWIKWIN
jgi:hypothetical protein